MDGVILFHVFNYVDSQVSQVMLVGRRLDEEGIWKVGLGPT